MGTTGHQYLASLLVGQTLKDHELQPLRDARDTIEAWLRADIGSAPRVYYAGSYAKQTMLRASYDLDIVVYFPSSDPSNLGQLFTRVQRRLLAGKFVVIPRTVALRLPYEGGFHIDVVPGRAQDATFRYATLYKNTTPPSTLQTSLKVHIEAVKDAGLSEIVRLAKLWRLRQGLELPTFPLEIAVARALEGKPRNDLEQALLGVLRFLANDFVHARIVDPANTNNIIELTDIARRLVAVRAQHCLARTKWSEIVW